MTEPLDLNKVVAEFMRANLASILGLAKVGVSGARNVVRQRLDRTYRAYILRLLERHSKAKSFFVRSEPIPLYEFFVPLDLTTQKRTIGSANAESIAAVAEQAIIIGSGGSGKSMMMRHILLSALVSGCKTPIFVELRHLDLSATTLENALLASLNANGLEIDDDFFRRALKAKQFLILLDGFDELDRPARTKVAASVKTLTERYPGNWLVLSSRPDQELEGWNAFTSFKVAPLSVQKAVALVEPLAFDEEIKKRFIIDLRKDLFDRHQSLLSNPLLLSIMLLTYHDTAHIPSKLSIFYNQAYEALFQKHDALKSGYQRTRRTTLDIQDFARVFSAFCVRSYGKRQFVFSVTSALEELVLSKKLTRIEFVEQDFLDDARQAVCLLVDEGADIAFAHRSFQEYFAARFISHAPEPTKGQLIKSFSVMTETDAVMPLLHEMDAFVVEQHYILPALRKLIRRISLKGHVGKLQYRRYMEALVEDVDVSDEPRSTFNVSVRDSELFESLHFAYSRYLQAPSNGSVGNIRKQWESLAVSCREAFPGERHIPIARALENRQFCECIMHADGMLGVEYLKRIVAVERSIRMRHDAIGKSIDAILG